MLLFVIICIIIGIFMLLLLIGVDKNMTDEERYQEDLEQMEYLKKYQEKKAKRKTEDRKNFSSIYKF